MTFQSKGSQHKRINWNPFLPTKRDIERTNKLAEKNPILVGALVFFLPVGAIIYLNRGENYLNFIVYLIIISLIIVIMFAIYVVINKDKGYEDIGEIAKVCDSMIEVVYVVIRIGATVESIGAVTLARKRKSEKHE